MCPGANIDTYIHMERRYRSHILYICATVECHVLIKLGTAKCDCAHVRDLDQDQHSHLLVVGINAHTWMHTLLGLT